MTMIAVITTVDGLDSARAIARVLVERRLSACVQISRIESLYDWRGTTEQAEEFRLFAKTVADRYAAVEAAILEHHPYDLPAVFALDIGQASAPYAAWVREQSSGDVAG